MESILRPRWKHHVFISYIGKDTGNTFTDHLYVAFKRKGILTYKDENELILYGNSISEELLKAIQESMFAVVVISRHYAFSTWHLIELTKIMECSKKTGLIVLPIFYHVDLSDVRNQKGNFKDAFAKHESNGVDMERIQRWRDTLKHVAEMSGWMVDGRRNESAIIEQITARIFSELNRGALSGDSKKLVGIDSLQIEVMNLLFGDELNDVRFIGICGMGGIGKTILAEFVYGKVCSQFETSSFSGSVREKAERHGLYSVQNQLISEIAMAEGVNIRNVHEGIRVIRDILRNKKTLVVFDDVDAETQFDALIGSHDWYGPGSRIIVTSRHRDLLRRHMDYIHEARLLNHDEALQLFSLSAFKKFHPNEDYIDLAQDFVTYAQGLPLALKVWGSSLYGRTINEWQSGLDKFKVFYLSRKIMDVLRISFDGLEELEQKLFLAIACFFKGKFLDKQLIEILESAGYYPHFNLETLKNKCLISISPSGELQMHNLLQAMGQEIVRRKSSKEPGLRGRFLSDEDILHVLTGTDAVEGIVQQLPLASTVLGSSLLSDRTVEGIVQQLPLAGTVLGPSLLDRTADAWKSFLDKQKANLGNEIFWNGWYQYNTYGENFQRNIEAIDLLVGILAFVLEIALSWVPNSKPFERVVLVVSWINCLTAWTIFLWEARSRRAQFALPRFRLPNGQPYGGTIDYVDKYTALGLVTFSTVCMIVNFSGQKIRNMGLVLSGVILGAKLHIEYLRRHVKRHSR